MKWILLSMPYLILYLSTASKIITTLPQLKRYELKLDEDYQSIKNRQNYEYQFEPASNPKVLITDSVGHQAQKSCEYIPQNIQIKQIDNIQFSTSFANLFKSSNLQMKVLLFQRLIYVVNNQLEISAFSYDQKSLQKLTQVKLDVPNYNENTQSGNYLIASTNQQYIYLFSLYGIWKIQTKSILSNIQKQNISFNYQVYDGTIHNQMIFVSTPGQGFIVFKIQIGDNLTYVNNFTTYNDQLIYPIDIVAFFEYNLIFVLGQKKNIYVYRKTQKSTIQAYDIIEFEHFSNFQLKIEGNRLYYSFLQGNSFKICELYYNWQYKKAELVRYYKMFDYIYDFATKGEALFVLSHDILDIVPTNIDPRLIEKENNGYRAELKSTKFRLIGFDYLVASDGDHLKLIKIQRNNSKIICNFKNHHENIIIKYKANLSSCDDYQNMPVYKQSYNSYCEIEKVINIEINIPQQIQRKKTILYAIVIGVGLMFLVGLVCLIQWRNGRLDIIDKMTEQIRKYRDRQKRTQHFVQQNQIELPKTIYSEENQKEDEYK